MNLKKAGKRVLYFVGGILIVFIASIILATSIENDAQWVSTGTFTLIIAILFGLGLFIVSLFPKLDEPPSSKNTPDKKRGDAEGHS